MKAYKKYFVNAIWESYPGKASLLISEIETKFKSLSPDISFSKTSPNTMDRRMEVAGYFLALMAVLDREGESREKIREISLKIASDYVKPKNKLQAYMKRLPVMLIRSWVGKQVIRYLDKELKDRGHPDGFVTRVITDKKETYGLGYGIDILECGICKLYNKHNYNKFSPILCEIDYLTTSLAGLEMVRAGTIANGAQKCDFRFKLTILN